MFRSIHFSRPAKLILGAALLGSVVGCGYFFGEEDDPLEGTRISVRQVAAASGGAGQASLPPERPIGIWSQAGGGANRVAGHAAGSISMTKLWSVSIGAGSDSESRVTAEPVASSDRVYALDAAAQVTAVDYNGNVVWRADLTPEDEDGRDGFGGGLALESDRLIVTTGFGEVVALNLADGSRLWTYKADAPVRSAPAVSRGLAVIVSGGGRLAALDIQTGEERWRVAGIEGGAAMLGGSAPAISGEVVAAPFASGDLGIYRLSDGRRGWSEVLGGSRRGSAMSLVTNISSAPVLYEGLLIAGSVSGSLVAYEIPTGRRVWTRDFGSFNRVWAAGRSLFVVSDAAVVMGLDVRTGVALWETQLPRYDDPEDREGAFAYGGPVLVGAKLYLTSTDGKLFRVNAITGEKEGDIDLPGGAAVPPITVNGRLYIVDDSGDLHAYQ